MSEQTIDRKHPIFTKQYGIFTPCINELANQIGEWLEDGATGGYIWGPSRYGKSQGVQYFLSDMLKERFGEKIPLLILTRTVVHRTAGGFFSEILEVAEHKYWDTRRSEAKKKSMCTDLIIALAKNANSNMAVLLIDEAQTMTDNELTWLTGLQNTLAQKKIVFTVIQIGSHQLDYVHSIQSLIGNAHIAARFFVRAARFHGLRNVAQLKFVLDGYEYDSEWPPESGISFTKWFGLQPGDLSATAPLLWDVFLGFFPKAYVERGVPYEIPMEHVAFTVERMLKAHLNGMHWDEICERANLVRFVEKTELASHLQLVSAVLLKTRKRS